MNGPVLKEDVDAIVAQYNRDLARGLIEAKAHSKPDREGVSWFLEEVAEFAASLDPLEYFDILGACIKFQINPGFIPRSLHDVIQNFDMSRHYWDWAMKLMNRAKPVPPLCDVLVVHQSYLMNM